MSHRVSKVLMAWLKHPRVSSELGRDVLMELEARKDLNVHVGFCYTTAAMEMGLLYGH